MSAPAAAAAGGRNVALTRRAGKLRAQGLDEHGILADLLASPERGGLAESECRDIARSIARKPAGVERNGTHAPACDFSLVETFAAARKLKVETLLAFGAEGFSSHGEGRIRIPMRRASGEIVSHRTRRADNLSIEWADKETGEPRSAKALSARGKPLGLIFAPPLPPGDLVIVEGEIDAMAVWEALAGVCAAAGFPGCTPGEQVLADAAEIAKGRRVFLIPDRDAGGEIFAQKAGEAIAGNALELLVARLPDDSDAKDPDEYLKGMAPERRGGAIAGLLEYSAEPWKPQAAIEVAPRAANWPDPLPLDRADAPPPLPATFLQQLPDALLDFILPTSDALAVAEDLVAFDVLATLSSAALRGASTAAFPEQFSPSPLAFYSLGTGPAGGGKSSALRAALSPLEELAREDLSFARGEFARFENRRRIEEKREAKLTRAAADGDQGAEEELMRRAVEREPDMLPPRSFILTQGTPEAIAEVALANAGRFAYLSAESEALEAILGPYRESGKTAPEVVLNAFHGDAVRQARVGAGKTREIERVVGCLLIQGTPEIMGSVLADQRFRDSGFLSRCCITAPTPPPREGDPRKRRGVAESARIAYHNRVLSIGRWLRQFTNPGVIRYTVEAQDVLAELGNEMVKRRDDPDGDLRAIASAVARVEIQAERIASLIHLAREGERCFAVRVPPEVAQAGADLARYSAAHMRRLLAGASPRVKLAKRIVAFLSECDGGRSGWREVQQRFKSETVSTPEIEEAAALLETHGMARIESIQTKGRPARELILNPKARGAAL